MTEMNTFNFDPDRCVECYTCVVACMDQNDLGPNDTDYIGKNVVELYGDMEKCGGCATRVKNKLIPACIRACPTRALKPK